MEIQLSITGLSHDGCGVGRTPDGKVAFVPGALPEETVSASLGESKKASPTPASSACSQQIPSAAHRRVRLPAFAAAAPS